MPCSCAQCRQLIYKTSNNALLADLLRHLDLDLWVVSVCVQHDHRVCQDIGYISALEGIWVAVDKSLCKLLHEPINLLCLSWQTEAVQERPVKPACPASQTCMTSVRTDGCLSLGAMQAVFMAKHAMTH